MGWEALSLWGEDVARIEPLTGGAGVNEVWSVRVEGQLAVARLGMRSDADLTWEAAVCWDPSGEDEFAVRRLADVRAG